MKVRGGRWDGWVWMDVERFVGCGEDWGIFGFLGICVGI